MFCYKCGEKLSSEMLYCPYCGNATILKKDKNKKAKTKEVIDYNKDEVKLEDSQFQNVRVNLENVTSQRDNQHDYGQYVYDFRKIFFIVLYTTLILLFFCNFIKVSFLGMDITKVNGFSLLKQIFKDGFFDNLVNNGSEAFDNLVNNNLNFSSIETLAKITSIVYLFLLVDLVESLVVNIVAFFRKDTNVNKLNFINSVNICVSSILITIFYFIIKNEFTKIGGQLFEVSSGVFAILIMSIVALLFSIWCRFTKYNTEQYLSLAEKQERFKHFLKKLGDLFCKYNWIFIVISLMVLIVTLFFNIANSGKISVSIWEFNDKIPGTYTVYKSFYLACLVIMILLLITLREKKLHLQNILTQIFVTALRFYMIEELVYRGYSITKWVNYLPFYVSLFSVVMSVIYLILYNKRKSLHYNDLMELDMGFFIEMALILCSPIFYYFTNENGFDSLSSVIATFSGVLIIINLVNLFVKRFFQKDKKQEKEEMIERTSKYNKNHPEIKRSKLPIIFSGIFVVAVLVISIIIL